MKLKGPDVPSTILKMPVIMCNIFVVSQKKVIKKLANDTLLDGSSFTSRTQLLERGGETTSERAFIHGEDGLSKRISGFQSTSLESMGTNTLDTPSILSTEQSEAHAEIERLRLELQNALAMYSRTCEDLIHAKNKDERCSKLKIYPILQKVYLERILRKPEIDAFAEELKVHQKALLPDNFTVLDRAMIEHDVLANFTQT